MTRTRAPRCGSSTRINVRRLPVGSELKRSSFVGLVSSSSGSVPWRLLDVAIVGWRGRGPMPLSRSSGGMEGPGGPALTGAGTGWSWKACAGRMSVAPRGAGGRRVSSERCVV